MKHVSGKRSCSVLQRKGRSLLRSKVGHRTYGRPGSAVLMVVPVHGNKDLKPGLQAKLMADSGLTDTDL